MCGRFGLDQAEMSETRFGAIPLPEVEALLVPRFNIAPTQDVLTVATSRRLDGGRGLKAMRWGLSPEWTLSDPRKPRPINVKVETALEQAYFRRLLARRRCLIPADGFYEWKAGGTGKQPWNIGLRDGALFAFAGIWDAVKTGDGWLVSCAILTTTPNELVGHIHNRMPVILAPEDEATWLADDAEVPDLLPCLAPLPAELMASYPVGPAVGDVKNDSPALRDPAPRVVGLFD